MSSLRWVLWISDDFSLTYVLRTYIKLSKIKMYICTWAALHILRHEQVWPKKFYNLLFMDLFGLFLDYSRVLLYTSLTKSLFLLLANYKNMYLLETITLLLGFNMKADRKKNGPLWMLHVECCPLKVGLSPEKSSLLSLIYMAKAWDISIKVRLLDQLQ